MTSPAEIVEALDGILYGDLFDCALTLDEATRFSRLPITQDQLKAWLELPSVISIVNNRDGFYFLNGRDELVNLRIESLERAKRFRARASIIARYLQYVPFVRGIVLTGSLAANDADEHADIDFLIIVAQRRLSLAFVLLGSFSRLTLRRLCCPNYYLSETHLEITRRNEYVAHELAQADAMAGAGADLNRANRWVNEYLPNARLPQHMVGSLFGGAALQWILEYPFRGWLGDRLDRKLADVSLNRLKAHHGARSESVPEKVLQAFQNDIELRFHSTPQLQDVVERYEQLKERTAASLEAAWHHQVGANEKGSIP